MSLASLFGFETKSASRAPDDDWWYTSAPGRQTAAGVHVNDDSALGYSAAWACTRLLCASGAGLPLNLYRSTDGRTREVARSHPLHWLLHTEPNPEMGSMAFRSLGLERQVNRGNFFAEIERSGSRVIALHPIHNSRVELKRDERDNLFYRVKGDSGQRTVDIEQQDMFHVPSIINDGICGRGVIEFARESIGLGLATEQQGAAYFGNGARPSIVIKGVQPNFLKDEQQRAEYRRQWAEIHQGPSNAGKPAILPPGADISVLSFTPEDSQFLQTRQHNIEEVARWYGCPPHMIGHLLRSTFNNIESQSREFVTYSLLPWLLLWEQEIGRKLLTPSEQKEYYAKHVVEGLLRGDSAARGAFYNTLFNIGVLNPNEIRELEDRNPREGGDAYFTPLNMQNSEQPLATKGDIRQGQAATEGKLEYLAKKLAEYHAADVTHYTAGLEATRQGVKQVTEDARYEAERVHRKMDYLALRVVECRDVGIQHTTAVGDSIKSELREEVSTLVARGDESHQILVSTTIDAAKETQEATQTIVVELCQQLDTAISSVDAVLSGNTSHVEQFTLAATAVVRETIARMLAKEIHAARTAAARGEKPAAFFAWLDEYYSAYEAKLADALRGPMVTVLVAANRDVSANTRNAEIYAAAHVAASKEQILQQTEIPAEQWGELPKRLELLGERWKVERVNWSLET